MLPRPAPVRLLLVALALSCATGCEERAERALGHSPLRREDAFQRLAAAAVTLGAAYMTAHDDAGASEAIETLSTLAHRGQEGQVDLEEAGHVVGMVEDARGTDGMVTIDKARPIVARAKALLARSRSGADPPAR